VAGLLAGLATRSVLKAAAPAFGAVVLALVGSAGAEWIERTAPFGLRAQRDRAQALASVNAANWRSMKADRDGWRAAERRSEFQRRLEGENAAKALRATEAANVKAATNAFDQGVAFGRALAQSGQTAHAQNPVTSPAAQPGRMRDDTGQDFAILWDRGAYRPGPSLPAQPR
jgi:hypothetical protein